MKDPVSGPSPAKRWLSAIMVLLLVLVLTIWYVAPPSKPKQEQQARPAPRSTEWAPEPAGPAVPVNLPKTPMTNVPDQKR
ncbi:MULTISPECIES: hypothetical protein [unclassified Novosphingobium]|uniref:hypothetical protein n=1 Tax=unclassified Novosphingobium TaxID=2644732 RepID=UPI00086F4799|nr:MULTISPECIES: hypothetical protein [unclassified Novosphingobium]NKI99673.1 hypothetical protein [Novosphingobium sp. SG707]MBN9143681.1 hypothetical protein [Novosphingobium sp.]MDR6706939.1 hypothetical protein [Novosphingobium sp. 1748]ODU84301.1 MAG: hypothetical protein ABT10_02630 [Novosphingobium sp. SCN 63-17]OJX92842.1 MAG: hypothetical protein BGP00_23235 [Novosphingobium sp. 63-713]